MNRLGSVLLLALALSGCGFLQGSNVFDLEVGDCFDDPGLAEEATEVANLPIVDCEEAHDYEVFAAFDMTDESYPGMPATQQIAFDECLRRFDAFVGIPYEESALDVTWLYPTAETWEDGDREIVCAVYHADRQKVTGTLADSRL